MCGFEMIGIDSSLLRMSALELVRASFCLSQQHCRDVRPSAVVCLCSSVGCRATTIDCLFVFVDSKEISVSSADGVPIWIKIFLV